LFVFSVDRDILTYLSNFSSIFIALVFFNNFRPISKLPLLSEILEKVVSTQLLSFVSEHNIFEKFQSGFRASHSTKAALLKLPMITFLAADMGQSEIY